MQKLTQIKEEKGEFKTKLSGIFNYCLDVLRINEHLTGDHNKELLKPMYATAIGLILRGYDDFEHNRKGFISFNNDVNVTMVERKQETEESKEETTPVESGDYADYFPEATATPFSEEISSENTDLFSQPEAEPQQPISKENEQATIRRKAISKIFGMVDLSNVKKRLMEAFEKFDDKPLN
jgi:cell division ATPase FtsA